MELLTTDDDGEVVVYECPDCGSQMETPVHDGELEDDQDFHPPLDTDEAGAEFEPEDAS